MKKVLFSFQRLQMFFLNYAFTIKLVDVQKNSNFFFVMGRKKEKSFRLRCAR